MSTPIVLTAFRCNACGQEFTSGLGAPQCLRCNSRNVTAQGEAASLAVPDPVPAGVLPDDDVVAAQVRASMGSSVPLTYRCPFCSWSTSWPAVGEPPATITQHQATHGENG